MKQNKYRIFLGWLVAAALLLTASCTDNLLGYGLSDEVTVSFMLSPESAAVGTRATDDDDSGDEFVHYPTPGEYSHISDGTKADVLIYAVYDKDGNLLEEYKGTSDEGYEAFAREGQTAKKIKKFPVEVNLTLKRNVTYKVVFWAQSTAAANYYDTEDLRKVEMRYGTYAESTEDSEGPVATGMPNNDEIRDVFCRAEEITVTGNGSGLQKNVYLYRPLAQINVGTSGYDFEVITRNATSKYLFSRIRLNRVARYLDVWADEVLESTTQQDTEHNLEAFEVVDYGYAPIPAYVNWPEKYSEPKEGNDAGTQGMSETEEGTAEDDSKYPKYPSYTVWDWKYNKGYDYPHSDEGITEQDYQGEEFLKVHLYDWSCDSEGSITINESDKGEKQYNLSDIDEDGYLDYSSFTGHNGQLSETFKYLSMCYVFAPNKNKDEPVLLNNVKVWMAADANGAEEMILFDINHVPVQRNWRTNIVGDLFTDEMTYHVKLDRNFAGEYNGQEENGEWKELTGPLADGVYYDAAKDEIQISNANGLIWFQKMVNGTMTVRKALDKNKLGTSYDYYSNGASKTLNYKGILYDESKPELMKRILVATHQISREDAVNGVNLKSKWPIGDNFHFTRTVNSTDGQQIEDYPAKVRLMADIDLTGIEWIPIGFEGRMLETLFDDDGEQDKVGDKNIYAELADNVQVLDEKPTYRGFFGIFDGNNHTISNLTTKRFSAKVHDNALQGQNSVIKRADNSKSSNQPADNPQWFGRGLFGQIGGNAEIKNVRLLNVDIYGCNGVGGIAGIAYGKEIKIENCIVDGGSIIVTPMYRGDAKIDGNNKANADRTFARGVYLGGIVGYFRTDGGEVNNCEVRNLYLQGYRRAGGLIGSINQKNFVDTTPTKNDTDSNLPANATDTYPASISNNKISNTVLVASQYSTFGMPLRNDPDNKGNGWNSNGAIRSGFGWDVSQYRLYSNKLVGGHELDIDQRTLNYNGKPVMVAGNDASGLTFAEFTIDVTDQDKAIRSSEMEAAPLKHMPMLSSWYADEIKLKANYYGEPSAYIRTKLWLFQIWSYSDGKGEISPYEFSDEEKTILINYDKNKHYNSGGNTFAFPIQLPEKVDIDWVEDSPRAGLYVESVTLDGNGNNIKNGRSLVTPTGVTDKGACVMYVTARNRYQFEPSADENFKKPTIIKNMVLRGQPYAYTGILLAPNKNMSEVLLDNVAIYDVYQTLALDNWDEETKWNVWPNKSSVPRYDVGWDWGAEDNNKKKINLTVKNSNLRGYTVPGASWLSVFYEGTTFEQGTRTGWDREKGERRTCQVETTTTFKGCYFKAPYFINIAGDGKVEFKEGQNYASAAKTDNLPITLATDGTKNETPVKCIVIESDTQGYPVVKYYSCVKSEITDEITPIVTESANPNSDDYYIKK